MSYKASTENKVKVTIWKKEEKEQDNVVAGEKQPRFVFRSASFISFLHILMPVWLREERREPSAKTHFSMQKAKSHWLDFLKFKFN